MGITVTHNVAAGQFESPTEHGPAVLTYVRRGDVLDLAHTRVPQELEGQGIGAALAKAALDYARGEGLKVVPSCPFVHAYLRKHREFASLVTAAAG